MRGLALALLLATGAAVPSLAGAQDGEHHHEGRSDGGHPGGGQPGGGHPQGGNPQGPRPAQAPATAPQAPAQRPARFEGDRSYRGDPGRFAGRGLDGAGPGGYRPQGGPAVAPGSGGYRPQPGQFGYRGGPAVAPGSGGYRPQPGRGGFQGGPGYGGAGYRPAPPPPGRDGGWNRGWRDDRRFDFRSYRVQNNYVFHLQPYYAPRGWSYGYRRFAPGFTLQAFLFDQDYWIDDPYAYRLPPAWGPYRWVRYYNDALLVDLRTGLVVDTVYGLFW